MSLQVQLKESLIMESTYLPLFVISNSKLNLIKCFHKPIEKAKTDNARFRKINGA